MEQDLVTRKNKGNDFFKEKKFQEALQVFEEAIAIAQSSANKQYLDSKTPISATYVILLINGAFACLKLQTQQYYQRAIQMATKALSVDSKNIKAMFRRGLARKELAETIERNDKTGSKEISAKLIEMYTEAKKDFEDVNILEKSNELAQEKFKETVRDIYRVTKAQGGQINLTNSTDGHNDANSQAISHSKFKTSSESPYQQSQVPKKRGVDMDRIMQQYKVTEASSMVQKKIEEQYLSEPLPETRAELEKALRELEKSPVEILRHFIYRCTEDDKYLVRLQPTFDMIGKMMDALLPQDKSKVQGEKDSLVRAILNIKTCKGFTLYWKSLVKREKQALAKKGAEFGIKELSQLK